MRSFLLFVGLMALCLVAGALLAYPAFQLALDLGAHFAFHRVATRISMLLLLIGFPLLLWQLRLADRASLGYGAPRPVFIRMLLRAWLLGALSMLPIVALLLLFGVREIEPGIDAAQAATIVLEGALSGLVVAFIEETFLRGAMHTAIERESGTRIAIALTAFLYSTLHFLNRTRIPDASASWSSGLDLLAGTFDPWGHPLTVLDSFLAIVAVGVLLGLVRARSGHIAACIGLHASWVWVIAITRELTTRNDASSVSWLVGAYDGVVGYLVLGWTLVVIFAWRANADRVDRFLRGSGVTPPAA
jgi:membrane protease YdiL (CAAX protease family)